MHKANAVMGAMLLGISWIASANFIWPAIGAYRGVLNYIFLTSIVLGLIIECFFMRRILPHVAIRSVIMITLIMNIVSALFGIVFISLIDVSLQYVMGISWLWHMAFVYSSTVVANICIEGFVCLQFWPDIDRQSLLSVLAGANAISVAIALGGAKLL